MNIGVYLHCYLGLPVEVNINDKGSKGSRGLLHEFMVMEESVPFQRSSSSEETG